MNEFHSALSFTLVRDFAYPDAHPLHYGVPLKSRISQGSLNTDTDIDSWHRPNDGPPWSEDGDLTSPIIKSREVGDRISKVYEFSVSSDDEIHGRAVALFDFTPENDNEAPLKEGQIIWVSYRHGQGWLVAEDPRTGETGLVPEEYVEILPLTPHNPQQHDTDLPPTSDESSDRRVLPSLFDDHHKRPAHPNSSPQPDSEGWVDEGLVVEPATCDQSKDTSSISSSSYKHTCNLPTPLNPTAQSTNYNPGPTSDPTVNSTHKQLENLNMNS